MMKKINKKAVSHVEMIISFVIFIGFVSFLLIVFNPLKIASPSNSYLDLTEEKILKYASVDLTVISLNVDFDSTNVQDCFYINAIKNVDGNLIVKNRENVKIDSSWDKQNLKINIEKSGDFYRLYFSNEFEKEKELESCDSIINLNYKLGVARAYKITSDKELSKLFRQYKSNEEGDNYITLKEELGLENDFNIMIRGSSGEIIASSSEKSLQFIGERYKPTGINIRARDIPINILNSTGDIIPAIMNIQVWG